MADGSFEHAAGGGMYNAAGSPTIANCIFTDNAASGFGGGLYSRGGRTVLDHCTFSANAASGYGAGGGGIYSYSSTLTLVDCSFSGNLATFTGGGMHNEVGSPVLFHCTLMGNSAESGGGMYNDSWHDLIAGNHAILNDCTFYGNTSASGGGGMYSTHCDSILRDCTFENNSTSGGIYGGGGILNERSTAFLTRCTFRGNSAARGSGGGFYNMVGSEAKVVSCLFEGNGAYYDGCGMFNRGIATVVNCTFSGNSGVLYSHSAGGGMSNKGTASTVVNCKFTANFAGFGGGMHNRDADAVSVVNCTFRGNSAGIEGGGIFNRDCDPVFSNCIIWGNSRGQISNYYETAEPHVTYCCVEGGYPGVGNISSNPMLEGASLYLRPGSPCIDAGNNDALPADTLDLDGDANVSEPIPFDLAYKLRRVDDPAVDPDPGNPGTAGPPTVDMGVYEVSAVFVDDSAASGGDGTSWATAYKYLQDALHNAATPTAGPGEIRVAGGRYCPDQSESGFVTPTDREATFELQSNLVLRGGYRGLDGGGDPDDRDIEAFEAILSGDLLGNDARNDPNCYDENSYHVVSSHDTDASAVLEGFTITAGNADGEHEHEHGGGMYNDGGGVTVVRCDFRGNRAGHEGGGMYNLENTATVSECTFYGNTASYGSCISSDLGSLVVSNCTFRGNWASRHSTIDNGRSSATVTHCIFVGDEGGGVYGWRSQLTVTNCTFSHNRNPHGVVEPVVDSYATVTNCIAWENYIGRDEPEFMKTTHCFVWDVMPRHCTDPNAQNICSLGLIVFPGFVRYPSDGGDGWIDDPNTPEDESANNDYGDLRLRPDSLCIDAGSNDADTDGNTPEIDPLPATDLDGRARFVDGDCNDTAVVDMGGVRICAC